MQSRSPSWNVTLEAVNTRTPAELLIMFLPTSAAGNVQVCDRTPEKPISSSSPSSPPPPPSPIVTTTTSECKLSICRGLVEIASFLSFEHLCIVVKSCLSIYLEYNHHPFSALPLLLRYDSFVIIIISAACFVCLFEYVRKPVAREPCVVLCSQGLYLHLLFVSLVSHPLRGWLLEN